MEETYELRSKLCEISAKLEEYKTAHKDVSTSKEEYIALRHTKPERKSEKEPRKPIKTKVIRIVLISILLACQIFSGITCIAGLATAFLWFVAIPILAFCFLSILVSFGLALLLLGEIIYKRVSKKKYEKAIKTLEENRSYNENEYPVLAERYERAVRELSCEYEKRYERAKARIDSIEEYFKENSGVLNKKYYLDIDRIITVLDEQRANKLTDAINLVLRDKRLEAQTKQKKSHSNEAEVEEGLYPSNIKERIAVNSINCANCRRKDRCIKIYCQLNEHFDENGNLNNFVDENEEKSNIVKPKEICGQSGIIFEGEVLSEETEIIE